MSASDKFERLIDQYIQVDDDGSVRLKGVRQPRFSDLMKLASIVQNIRAQRDASRGAEPLASLTDDQVVAALTDALCLLDDHTFEQLLRSVGARKGRELWTGRTHPSQPAPETVPPSSEASGPREEREPTEGEERYSVANHVQHVPSDEDTPTPALPPPPFSGTPRPKQGASARTRDAPRGASGSSAQSTTRARDSAPTLSPRSLRDKAKE